MTSIVFDRIVVGSSPLAVMHAVKFSRDGLKTALVEKEEQFGGLWQSCLIEDVGKTECACHLIEFYAGSYETLSTLTGVAFERLSPQPIKVLEDGRHLPYTTRLDIFKEPFHLLILFLGLIFIRCINTVLPSQCKIHKGKNLSFRKLSERISIVTRYRLLEILNFSGIKAPMGGYRSFPDQLREAVVENGIRVIQDRVDVINENSDNLCEILLASGKTLQAKRTYLTESVRLKSVNGISFKPFQSGNVLKEYWHVPISIDHSCISLLNSYIHLPKNKYFHRITVSHQYYSSKSNQTKVLFLIQTRSNPALIENLEEKIVSLLEFCRVTTKKQEIKLHAPFSGTFSSQALDLSETYDHFGKTIRVIRSVGDISKSIILNPEIMVA